MFKMSQRRIITIYYQGHRQLIRYILGTKANQILRKIMREFKIPRSVKHSLVLTNKQGEVYTKRQINKYLTYFPDPRKTLYMKKVDQSVVTRKILSNISLDSVKIDTSANAPTTNNKRKRNYDNDDDDDDIIPNPTYPWTSVFRMNCFRDCYPPPTKRARFCNSLNTTSIIPAQVSTALVGTLNHSTASSICPYTAYTFTTPKVTKNSSSEGAFNDSTKSFGSSMTLSQIFSPLYRTKSFIKYLPTRQ